MLLNQFKHKEYVTYINDILVQINKSRRKSESGSVAPILQNTFRIKEAE